MAKLALNSFNCAVLFFYLSTLVLGQGTQFITGPCTSDADCASGCCGFTSGKCAGPIVAQERDGGCGFGDSQPNDNAAVALGFSGPAPTASSNGGSTGSTSGTTGSSTGSTSNSDTNSGGSTSSTSSSDVPGAANAGNGKGAQFITGPCKSDADCASGCCGFNTGKCAGAIIAQERDGGCGFGDGVPNDTAAVALGFSGSPPTAASNGDVSASMSATSGSSTGSSSSGGGGTGSTSSSDSSVAGAGNAGNGHGAQFITGPCESDADCASGCCGFNTGKCAGAVIAQERDGGCGFGDGVPNDNAAQAFRNNQRRW